jgi:16S rRNA (guanine(1405)-N(7))-methyltransferase
VKYTASDLDSLVAAVLESAKNRHVASDVIRRFGEMELERQASVKGAVKETKNRLHQAGGAYLERAPNYGRWRAELAAAADAAAIRDLSLIWMQSHSSTRERLPILEDFYSTTLHHVGRIESVIDIACGLNPLAIGWMGLSSGTKYYAYDMYGDMTGFLSEYLRKIGVDGAANSCDCAASAPKQKADLAFILKFLPVLEQIEKGSTLDWLKHIDAGALLVSFPTRSLGGKGKGMAQNYEARFMETISGENWHVEKFVFENELCFLVKR